MINKVTVTGADDSIQPGELLKLCREFPFFEAGILVSESNWGTPRFPSIGWIDDLDVVKIGNPELKLSMHACGRYVRDLVEAKSGRLFEDMAKYLPSFERIQLNTHNIKHGFHADFVTVIQHHPVLKEKEWIFQYDEANAKVVEQIAQYADAKCAILYDASGGNGILPETWKEPFTTIKTGYAGGLSPDNLGDQIRRIEEKAGATPIWIDIETHVRSNEDRQFDLNKVWTCLEIVRQHLIIDAYRRGATVS